MREQFLRSKEYSEAKLISSLAISNEISNYAVTYEECFFDRENFFYYVSEFNEVNLWVFQREETQYIKNIFNFNKTKKKGREPQK